VKCKPRQKLSTIGHLYRIEVAFSGQKDNKDFQNCLAIRKKNSKLSEVSKSKALSAVEKDNLRSPLKFVLYSTVYITRSCVTEHSWNGMNY
jgi:hypothetical protein